MNRKVGLVLKGFMELDSNERKIFVDELNNYVNGKTKPDDLKKSIRESTTINLGPAPSGCPCCGRG